MKTNPDVKEITTKLGIKIKKIELYEIAFTHRSYLNEAKKEIRAHNERLEFLGDAVLELIISEYLYTKHPDHPEGDLTSFRSAIVKAPSLAKFAKDFGFGEYLRMSKGEEITGGRTKDYLLANTFESFLGALYIDLGYKECQKFIYKHLVPELENIIANRLDVDQKSKFQEMAQSLFKLTPEYKLLKEEGPDHEKIFTMAVFLGKKQYGIGKGPSKQKAEEEAALNSLKMLREDKSVITS